VELNDHGGNWTNYIDAVYAHFRKDFIHDAPYFRGRPVRLKRHPMLHDKEATFWHCVSTGPVEAERLPDLRRAERILWIRACIEHKDELKVWSEWKGKEERVHLWLKEEGYLLVLAIRKGYAVLWTAFFVEHEHQRRKYDRRYEAGQKP
jgi:hypothetical protein